MGHCGQWAIFHYCHDFATQIVLWPRGIPQRGFSRQSFFECFFTFCVTKHCRLMLYFTCPSGETSHFFKMLWIDLFCRDWEIEAKMWALCVFTAYWGVAVPRFSLGSYIFTHVTTLHLQFWFNTSEFIDVSSLSMFKCLLNILTGLISSRVYNHLSFLALSSPTRMPSLSCLGSDAQASLHSMWRPCPTPPDGFRDGCLRAEGHFCFIHT